MTWKHYVDIARIDHWFKNVFMLPGVIVAVYYEPNRLSVNGMINVALAIAATCLVASSNYVLNEMLDAPTDRNHPIKRHRPVAAGKVSYTLAYVEWLALACVGLGLGWWINRPFTFTLVGLWVMGALYNVRPIRTKELPYVDVITESINNPLRLLLGWFALVDDRLAPLSLLIAYWALGAFFMATKRLAELRMLGDRELAASYRKSFRHYTQERLLVSMFFYITACSFFGGVFIVRCKLELLLFVPFAAGVFAYYLKLGLDENSPVQNPERLGRERGFMAFGLLSCLLFVALMFTEIPILYEWFNFEPSPSPPLWVVGSRAQ